MRKREIHSVAHWAMMFLLLMFPILMVAISPFSKSEIVDTNLIETQAKITSEIDIPDGTILTYTKDRQLNGYSAIFPFTATSLDLPSLFGDVLITQLGTYSSGNNNYIVGVPNDNYSDRLLILTNDINIFSLTYDASGTTYQPTLYTSNFSLYMTTYQKHVLDYRNEVNVWIKSFLDLPINSWYQSLMNVIGVGFTNSTVMNVIYVMPVYILWVFIFDVIVDCFLVIIKLPHKLLNRLSGGENE